MHDEDNFGGDYTGEFFKEGNWGFSISQNKINWLNRELEWGGMDSRTCWK